ncbi:MAG TPA: molecular chaperone TorD [Pantoea sp.]|nr:molecular chaperone TorD [Pantoea sp.]
MAGQLTPHHYACLYGWFAGMFARELDQQQLAQLQSPDVALWLEHLAAEAALQDGVLASRNSIAALQLRPDARLELAADFAGLFLMSQKQAALPYASCYEPGNARFRQAACEEMQALLLEAGLERDRAFPEPEDHLAICLELLSYLSFAASENRANAAACLALRDKTLGLLWRWLPAFTAHCIEHDAFGFYAAQSQLLLALVTYDRMSQNAL